MEKRRAFTTIFAFSVFLVFLAKQAGLAQATSTLEERARWVEITHRLESNPLDQDLDKQGEWAVNRLSEVHDVHVRLCAGFLYEFNEMKYLYSHALRRQFMLASAAFMIQNPSRTDEPGPDSRRAKDLAAVESVLRAYSSILQRKPDARYKLLDDLLDKETQGKLADYVKKRCSSDPITR